MSERQPATEGPAALALRLDKWLWHCRLIKTRTQAAGLIASGKVRVNKERVTKPSHTVKSGDVVTAVLGTRVRVIKVVAFGVRRGPAPEARSLYEELTPAAEQRKSPAPSDPSGSPGPGDTRADLGAAVATARPDRRGRRLAARLRGKAS